MQMTISSRDFNQDISRAKKASKDGIVIITDRGKPSYVLMSYTEYNKLQHGRRSLFDAMAEYHTPDIADVDFIIPLRDEYPQAATFD